MLAVEKRAIHNAKARAATNSLSTLYEHITKNHLQQLADEEVYTRGRHHYLAERVRIARHTENEVQGRVFASGIFLARIDFDPQKGKVSYKCDCDTAGVCEHIIALGLAIEAKLQSTHGYAPSNLITSAAPPVPGPQLASSTPAPGRARVRRLKTWESMLEKLGDASFAGEPQWVPVFYLEVKPSYWNLHAKKAFLKKDGAFGRTARMAHTDLGDSDLLTNRMERLAISYLLTRAEAGQRSSNIYALQKHALYDCGENVGHLLELLQNSRILLGTESTSPNKPLQISAHAGHIEFRTELRGKQVKCQPYLVWQNIDEAISNEHYILTSDPVWLLREHTLIRLEGPRDASLLLPFREHDFVLKIPQHEFVDFLRRVEDRTEFAQHLEINSGLEVSDLHLPVQPRLYLRDQAGFLEMELKFAYGEHEFAGVGFSAYGYKPLEDGREILRIHRDRDREVQFQNALVQTGVTRIGSATFAPHEDDTVEWLLERVNTLLKQGFELFGESELQTLRVRRSQPTVQVTVSSAIDWFDLKLIVDFDGIGVSLSELKRALRSGRPYIKLADDTIARIPEQWIQKFRHLLQFGDVRDEQVKLSRIHATLIDTLAAEADLLKTDASYDSFIRKLKSFQGIGEVTPPADFNGTLRPYQKAGLSWMQFLQEYKFGGCLADDMGLGKTIQALALLLHEKEKGIDKPSLIVAPTSVVFNWEREIEKFAPKLRVLNQTGPDRQRDTKSFSSHDIILTTYGTIRRDIAFLKNFDFHYAILDESQNIKNPNSQTAKAIRLLRAGNRLALTGTPVENNTVELWSQFAFLNPGLLGSQRYFRTSFATPIEKHGDQSVANFLQRLAFPFILRRTKEQVEKDLPPKTESIFYATMVPEQQKLYEYWRDYYRASILKQIDMQGLNNSRIAVLEGLMKLRQIACHPGLVDTEHDRGSGKYDALVEQLEEIMAEGHKVLIFSQFVKMLTILRKHLDRKAIHYEYLDGSTKDRESCVRNFQENDAIKLFLISLRAGGTGLNLTAADYVFHYDPWWNPAVEMQATDRSHRIGQSKHVFVYKFITKGTVEEKVLELQKRKQELVGKLISTDRAFFKQLTRDDITMLFE